MSGSIEIHSESVDAVERSSNGLSVSERAAAGYLAGYSGHTQEAYLRDLRDWAKWCNVHEVDLLDATSDHIKLYSRELERRGLRPATLARRLSTLSGYYRHAVDEDLIDRSPVTKVKRPKVDDTTRLLGLDRSELVQLLDQAANSSTRDHGLVCLLALNGLRVSEACGADVTDISEQRGHRTLKITRKGGKERLIPLAPRTARVLSELVGDRTSGPLFLSRTGRRLDRRDAAALVGRLATSAGIDKAISPHSLRHTFVTLALDAGVSLRDVQDSAGHSDPRTTRRYDQGRNELDRNATYAVASLVGGGG